MNTLRATVNFAGWRILPIWVWTLLLPALALAAEAAKKQPAAIGPGAGSASQKTPSQA